MTCFTRAKALTALLAGAIICCIGGILCTMLPSFLKKSVFEAMVQKETPAGQKSGGPDIKMYTHYYLFNYTNSQEWLDGWKDGVKPIVKQLGPYVYRKFSTQINRTFYDNATIMQTYSQNWVEFQSNMSKGSLKDVVVLPNVPLRAFAQRVPVDKATETLGLIEGGYFGLDAFITPTVGEILYEGFYSDVMNALVMISVMPENSEMFSFFGASNNSIGHSPFIKTGADDIKNLGKVVAFGTEGNQQFNITKYDSYPCNEIEGTAGQFHPDITKDDVLTVINEGLCRTMKFRYRGEGDHHGVMVYKFQPDAAMLGDANVNPDNACFCSASTNSCRPTGVYSLLPCIGAPMAMSWPHFLMADKNIREAIDGLEPDFYKHGTQFEIFPLLGVPLKASVRIQTNLEVKKIPWLPPLDYLPEIYLPLFWMSDGADLDEAFTTSISSKIGQMIMIGYLVPLAVLVIGGIIGAAGIICSVVVNFKVYDKSEKAKVTPIKRAWVSPEY